MARLLSASLVLVALLAVTACTGGGSPSPTGAAPTTGGPTGEASGPAGSGMAGAACSVTDDGPIAVTIENFTYSPDPVEASVGEGIAWTNMDDEPHTATLDEGECGTDQLANGETGALVFNVAGTYTYHCEVHPDMKGTIEIVE